VCFFFFAGHGFFLFFLMLFVWFLGMFCWSNVEGFLVEADPVFF